METKEITDQILKAWDEITEPETPAEGEPAPETDEPETEEEETAGEEQEEGAAVEPSEEEEAPATEEEPETEDEPEEETDGEDEPEAEPEVESSFETDDPEARAFLSKYQGDVERALKGGLQMQQALSRQNLEKQALEARVGELETQLAQTTPFETGPHFLTAEQREWVGQAMESGNPTQFVRAAVEQGEFGLARAVCSEWGNEAPYEALRLANAIDAAEYAMSEAAAAPVEYPPIDHRALLDALVPYYPEIPQYAGQMTETIAKLGNEHPLVVESRSNDPETAMRGVIGIYEIARASSAALASTRETVRNGHRVDADAKRKKAVVSSAAASPSPSESARPKNLGPGLTLEALDDEWERNK